MYEKNHFPLISDNRVAKNNTTFKLEGVFQQVSLTPEMKARHTLVGSSFY